MQHLAPPKSETDPPLPVIAKNPIPETSFLSKFKQAKSKFEEKLEKKKKKIKITTPQSKKKPKIEICKTPKTPQAPKVNKIDNYIFGSKVNLKKSSNRKSDKISMNTHEGNSLQSIAGKPREILQRIVTSQSAPHPRRQPPPPHTTSIQTENSHCDTSNTNELQSSFGEQIRYADKQLSAGTSLRNVGLCPVLNKHVKVGKGAPPEDRQATPHTRHHLLAKSKIKGGDKPPPKVSLECEDNIPEVENEVVKNNVRKTVDFGKVNSIKVMFERKLVVEKEDNTSRFRRQPATKGRQPGQLGSIEDNIGNFAEAPDQVSKISSKLNLKAKRLRITLPRKLLSQERGNLGGSNGTQEKL